MFLVDQQGYLYELAERWFDAGVHALWAVDFEPHAILFGS